MKRVVITGLGAASPYGAGVVAYWNSAVVKPSVFAVEPPQTLFDLIRHTGSDRVRENFSNMGKVFWMYRSVCSPVLQFFQ